MQDLARIVSQAKTSRRNGLVFYFYVTHKRCPGEVLGFNTSKDLKMFLSSTDIGDMNTEGLVQPLVDAVPAPAAFLYNIRSRTMH